MNSIAVQDQPPATEAPERSFPQREEARHEVGPVVVTTAGLPESRQFEAWRDVCVPYLDTGVPHLPREHGFKAKGLVLPFGSFMFYGATLPPYDYSRTAKRIRQDSLDHWIVAICRRGAQRQRSGDDVTELQAGVPYVFSMARPFEAVREGPEIEWQSIFIARDAMPELEAAFSASLGRPLHTPTGRLLAGYLGTLHTETPGLTRADLPHLASATKALVAAALAPSPETVETARPQIEGLQFARIKRLIREHLGAATLGPAKLCALGGISRSALYRLFEPVGGVAHYIQRVRLAEAHRLLMDPDARHGIAEIAEATGFFEPSTFSRAFRREYGMAPRDLRLAMLAGRMPASSRRTPGAMGEQGSVMDLLRRL